MSWFQTAAVIVAVGAAVPAMADDGRTILANTREVVREPGPHGYGKALHGRIHLNGHAYPFVSGGSGRGSAPFGVYHVGPLGGFQGRRGIIPGFSLSNVYDPFAKDTRSGLFIHPGRRASKGCLAVYPTVWAPFVRDMLHFVGRLLFLGHKQPEPPWTEPIQRAKHHGKVIQVAQKRGSRIVSQLHRPGTTRIRHHTKRFRIASA